MQPGSRCRRATFPSTSRSHGSFEQVATSPGAFDFPPELLESRRALRVLCPPTPTQSWFPAHPWRESKSPQPSQMQSIDLPERKIRLALGELCCRLARDLAPLLEEPRLASRIWCRQFGLDCSVADEEAAPASARAPATPETPPEPGDVVELRYYRLPHLVVAEAVERHPVTGLPRLLRAIHYGRPSLFGSIRVMRDDFRLDNGGGVAVRRYPTSACRPAGETIDRARSCLGQAGHSMLDNNAGQFARWCKLHSAGSAVQRSASLPVFEEHSELRAGDHIAWPASAAADINASAAGSVHAEVRAVGRRHNLLALRLLMFSTDANSVRLEHAYRRTVVAYPAIYPAIRHRLVVGPTPALPPERLASRAAAFLGAVFQTDAVSSLSFAAALASARDPLEALAMSNNVSAGTASSISLGVESVQLNDLRVGDVVSIDAQPPGLLTELQAVEVPDGFSCALVTATLLIYGHAPVDVSREPVREFRCFVDARRTGFHQRIRVSLQHADFACPLAEACVKHIDGYKVQRVGDSEELQPGCVISYRRHVSDIGVDDFDENDYDDDDDCHRLVFRHAVVSNCLSGSDRQKAEVGLIYFSPAMGWIRRIRRVLDLARDEVFRVEYVSGRARSLEDSLERAERRLGGGGGGAVDELEDAEAWRLGAKYDLRTNNGRQFARWCRQRDDFELDNDLADLDSGGVEWLQAWQSRLVVRQLPESHQKLRYCLHRCLQAVSGFSDASPLSAVAPLMSACLLICSAADSTAATAANQQQQLVRRALCPGFFAVLAASVASASAGQAEEIDDQDGVGENNNSSLCPDPDSSGNGVNEDEDSADARAFLVCFAASVSGAALDFEVDGGGGGVGFSKQLADLRRFFRP